MSDSDAIALAADSIVKVSVFCVPVNESHSLAYCVLECHRSEAHGAALVEPDVAAAVVSEVRRLGAALVGKTSDALQGDLARNLSTVLLAATGRVQRVARAVLVDAVWALVCQSHAWWRTVCELGPRGVANACCEQLDRVCLETASRINVEAMLRRLEPYVEQAMSGALQRGLQGTCVLPGAVFLALDRLRRAVQAAQARSFASFSVPVDGEIELDAARVKHVRALVGDSAAIEVDARGSLLPSTALELVRRLAADAHVSRIVRPFAAVDVIAHRELQSALDAAGIAVVVCPGSCHDPLLAKQYAAEPAIRELAAEWRDDTTAAQLLTVLTLCAAAGKTFSLLSESQLESLRAAQMCAVSAILLMREAPLRCCDEDSPHRFVGELKSTATGTIDLPQTAGSFASLLPQFLADLVQQQQQAASPQASAKRARTDDAPVKDASPPPPPPPPPVVMSYTMPQQVYGVPMAAAASSSLSSSTALMQCYKCRQYGHISKDCPLLSGSDGNTCFQCGMSGHWASQCPYKSATNGATVVQSGGAGSGGGGAGGGSTNKCFQCGQVGHWANQCSLRLPKGVCYHCGQAGHIAPNCPARGPVQCFKCGGYGHVQAHCPAK
jgi:hypothetical protein